MTILKTNTGLLLLASAVLTACGGGGGSDGGGNNQLNPSTAVATTTASTANETAASTEVTTQSSVNSTEDLVVTETFLFSSNYKVAVRANLSPNYEHLTVCYTKGDSNKADYSNCLLRADLDSGVFNGELLLTNDTNLLAVSAWDYSDAANPVVTYWDREVDGDLISVN